MARRLTKDGKNFVGDLGNFVDALRQDIEQAVSGFYQDESQRKERVERCAKSFRKFALTYFPHYCEEAPGQVHDWLYENLQDLIDGKKGGKLAAAAPRGEGKSSTVSLIFVLWCILSRRKRFVVMISDAKDQAALFLGAIRAELEVNPRLKYDYPDSFGEGPVWQNEDLVLRSGEKISARGSGQKIRGMRHGSHRPDLVIGDDLENDTHVRTPEQRKKLAEWLKSVVLYLGPPSGAIHIVVIGTVLHVESLLAGLLKSKLWRGKKFQSVLRWPNNMDAWDKFEAIALGQGEEAARAYYLANKGEMDAGAEVSWPQARPLVDLMLLRAEDHRLFDKEQQNDPTVSDDNPFADSLRYWDTLPNPHECVMVGAVDPSMGKRRGDPSAIVVGMFHRPTGTLFVVHADIKLRPPAKIIKDVIAAQRRWKCRLWVVEEVQFQEFFKQQLVKESAAKKTPVPARGTRPDTDKELRIESLQPHCENGLILLDQALGTLNDQLRHWPHASHDDGPDALEMLWVAVQRYALKTTIRSVKINSFRKKMWGAYRGQT